MVKFRRDVLEALGAFGVLLGVVAAVMPDLLEDRWWIFVVGVAGAAAWATSRSRLLPLPEQKYCDGKTKVRLVEGDLFRQDASVMIGMTSTFDTSVDVIDPKSVQGSFLASVFGGSETRLNAALGAALADVTPEGRIEKEGKNDVYPLGTVAVVPGTHNIRYYCAAYARMDERNIARGTVRSVLKSLEEVWECVDERENKAPICVPLIGQGQARIQELTPEIAVRLIAFSFILRAKRGAHVSEELRIVIHPKDRHKIDVDEFQAFLSSLA